ncbi:hypothetical protein [Streptomyces alkaliterrae]|nr:hypothetical protein [Streptomyces alkaliterrae]
MREFLRGVFRAVRTVAVAIDTGHAIRHGVAPRAAAARQRR